MPLPFPSPSPSVSPEEAWTAAFNGLSQRIRRYFVRQEPHHPDRPEEEGRWTLPHGEYSLDVTVRQSYLACPHLLY